MAASDLLSCTKLNETLELITASSRLLAGTFCMQVNWAGVASGSYDEYERFDMSFALTVTAADHSSDRVPWFRVQRTARSNA